MRLRLVLDERPLPLMALSLGVDGPPRRAPIGPLHFRFRLGAAMLDCRFDEVGDVAVLTAACPLGRLPPPRTAPDRHAAVLHALEAAAQAGIRIRRRHGGVVAFSVKLYPPAPVSAQRLVAELTAALLPARPWMELMQDILDPAP